MKKSNGRTKGQKDKKPRKPRSEWTGQEISFMRKNWHQYSIKEFAERFNKSKQSVKANANKIGLGNKKCFSHDYQYVLPNPLPEAPICGIYGLVHPGLNKIYVGSSIDCVSRIKRGHLDNLSNRTHPNKNLNELSEDQINSLYYVILEECEESTLMERETYYLNRYDKVDMFNEAYNISQSEALSYLNKSFNKRFYDNYTVSENGCWEYFGSKDTKGYGKINLRHDGCQKTFTVHRAAYYKHYGEYPNVVRHLCNNRICINPEHLASGSHRENVQDKLKIAEEKFESLWVKYKGDKEIVSREMGLIPYTKGGLNYSTAIYRYIAKLDLIRKYPEIAKKGKQIYRKITSGSRGPRKSDITGKVVGSFKCVESHFADRRHKWLCMDCGRTVVGQTQAVKRPCKVCEKT